MGVPSGERPLVLVAGACLGGWAWHDVAGPLRERGHEVHAVTLTGLGERVHLANPTVDLQTHISDVVNLLDYEDLDDALLVGHSYAGALITAVAAERAERLNALVYLDTGPLPDGMAIVDVQTEQQRTHQRHAVEVRGEGWRWPVPDRATLETGLFGSTAGLHDAHHRLLEQRATPQPYATFTSPLALRSEPPQDLRRVAILCSDGGLDLETARARVASGDRRPAAFAGPGWELHELPTGHWPMFSLPGQLADLLHRLAAAEDRATSQSSG